MAANCEAPQDPTSGSGAMVAREGMRELASQVFGAGRWNDAWPSAACACRPRMRAICRSADLFLPFIYAALDQGGVSAFFALEIARSHKSCHVVYSYSSFRCSPVSEIGRAHV